MKPNRARILTVLVTGLLLFAGTAIGSYAANGGPLLLGKSNKATKTTKIKNSKGTALSLKSKTGKPPLAVSNATKVTNLNADLVDGLDGPGLQTKSYVYTLSGSAITSEIVTFALPGLPTGRYLVDYDLNVGVTGPAPSFVGCFMGPVTITPAVTIDNVGQGISDGSSWFISGGGFLDFNSTKLLYCQRQGGTDMSFPAVGAYPSKVTFTRVDDVTTGASSATPLGPKGVAGLGR
jgi:hypothetical protein